MQVSHDSEHPIHGWKSATGLVVGLSVVAVLFGVGLVGFLALSGGSGGGGGVASAMRSLVAVLASAIAVVGVLLTAGLYTLVWHLARRRARAPRRAGRGDGGSDHPIR